MRTAEIVIIGAGIAGANLAYLLAQRGVKQINLLEREYSAAGSSGRATGGLRQQFTDELDIRFAREGVRFYQEFSQSTDTALLASPHRPPRFEQYGYLFLVTQPASWQAMQGFATLQRSLGVPTQLLTPAEIQQHVPQLQVDDVLGGSFCQTDGYSDPGAMTKALIEAARQLGVSVYEHASVNEIQVVNNRVQAVKTAQETIYTHLVVNAAGVLAPQIAQLVGINDLPIWPLPRQLYLTEPFADLPADVPMVVDLATGFHFRRREGGILLAMPHTLEPAAEQSAHARAPEAFELKLDERVWPQIQREIRRRCPSLATARVARAWTGLYEMTPDEHPILGKTEVEGFLCICGFSGHGFMHTPMAAKLLTEQILNEPNRTLEIEPFALERFRTNKLLTTTRLL